MMNTSFTRKDCFQAVTPGCSSLTRLIVASMSSGDYTSDSSATDSDRCLTCPSSTDNLVMLSQSKFDTEVKKSSQDKEKHNRCCKLAALCAAKVTFVCCPKPDHSSMKNTRNFARSPCIDKFPRIMPPVDEDEDDEEDDHDNESDHYDDDDDFDSDDDDLEAFESLNVKDTPFENI